MPSAACRSAGRGIGDAADVEETDISEFLSSLRSDEYAPGKRYSDATIARVLAAVRGLHRYLLREGDVKTDPSEPIGTLRIPRALPKALSTEEVEGLLRAVPTDGAASLRDRAMLELLYAAGLRISELTSLDVDDLDLDLKTVRCIGKGSKERVVPIGRAAVEAAGAYLTQARPGFVRARSQPAWARSITGPAILPRRKWS